MGVCVFSSLETPYAPFYRCSMYLDLSAMEWVARSDIFEILSGPWRTAIY